MMPPRIAIYAGERTNQYPRGMAPKDTDNDACLPLCTTEWVDGKNLQAAYSDFV